MPAFIHMISIQLGNERLESSHTERHLEGCGQQQVEYNSTVCPGIQEDQLYLEVHQAQHC